MGRSTCNNANFLGYHKVVPSVEIISGDAIPQYVPLSPKQAIPQSSLEREPSRDISN